MGTPREVAQQRLDAYLQAEIAILTAGQEGTVGRGRRREAELVEVRRAIAELQAEIADYEAAARGGSRLITVVPL